MSTIRATRLPAIGTALALGFAACGGAATEEPTTGGATAAPAESRGPAATSVAGEPTKAPNPAGGPANTATVTIGSDRYDFTDVKCSILTTQYIQAGNYGGDPEVVIVLPPDGWEAQGDVFSPPEVTVTIGSGIDQQVWFAGDDPQVVKPLPDGSTSLDYNVPEGRPVTATGTGMFVDIAAANFGREWSSVAGSFEVSCP